MTFKSVLLPAPLRPTTPSTSPAADLEADVTESPQLATLDSPCQPPQYVFLETGNALGGHLETDADICEPNRNILGGGCADGLATGLSQGAQEHFSG